MHCILYTVEADEVEAHPFSLVLWLLSVSFYKGFKIAQDEFLGAADGSSWMM